MTHGLDDPESVQLSYLMGVEALRSVRSRGIGDAPLVRGAPSVYELAEGGALTFSC